MYLTIDYLELIRNKLIINEYLNLLKLRYVEENTSFPYELDPRYMDILESKGFVEHDPQNDGYILSSKGRSFFEGDDLFEEFYKLYPTSVETGLGRRAISAKDPNSTSGKQTHEIWKRVTKNKPGLQKKIIDCLKRELEHRRSTDSMSYIQGIDTWLRNATWEKWEDIPEQNNSKNYTKL
jgi:hypothetical protein